MKFFMAALGFASILALSAPQTALADDNSGSNATSVQAQAEAKLKEKKEAKEKQKSNKPTYNLNAKSVGDINSLPPEERENLVAVTDEKISAYVDVMHRITAMQSSFFRKTDYENIADATQKRELTREFYRDVAKYLHEIRSPLTVRDYFVITHAARNYPPIGGQIQAKYLEKKKQKKQQNTSGQIMRFNNNSQ